MKVKGCTRVKHFNLKSKQISRTTKIGCSIWSNIASKCRYENTTLTLSKRHFRDLWKNLSIYWKCQCFCSGQGANQSLIYSLCFHSGKISLIWENTCTKYQHIWCFHWWYSVQCLTRTISKSNSVFIAVSQTKKQWSHASCINISCYLILLWLVVLKFYMQTIFNSNFHLDAKSNNTILLMINIKMISSHMYSIAYCYYVHTQ